MQFGISTFVSEQGVAPQQIARLIEAAGFESFFVSEHSHIPLSTEFPLGGEVPLIYKSMYDPLIALGAAAAVTEKLKLGTAICILPQRDPIHTAKELATLDRLSGGRIVFGIGAGWNPPEMENHGIPFSERFVRTKENLQAMQTLWSEDEAQYQGDLVSFEKSWMYPKPMQPTGPELSLAGAGPNILNRCVSLGCGWMPVFAMTWNDAMRGKQTPLDTLADDQSTLRNLEEKFERPRTKISAMGLPPQPEFIDQLLEQGVERMILTISAEGEAQVEQALGDISSSIRQYTS